MAADRSTSTDPMHDPYMATFDRGVALTAYGLLFVSPFLFGSSALAAMGMAFAHRDDAHSLMRSHYRFQIRIFWTTVVCMVIGAALAIGAGGMALVGVYHFLREQFPAMGLPAGGLRLIGDPQEEESWLLIGGIAFLVGGIGYVVLSSAYGFIKLLVGRPIRHRNA